MSGTRKIFGPYHNGSRLVYGDPLKIHRRLTVALKGDPNKVISDSKDPNYQVAAVATEKLARAATEAFDLLPLDPQTGQGATEDEALSVLATFNEWLEKKD
jgi:hypothetical protein